MKKNTYKVFISFSMTDNEKEHTKSYFYARNLANTLNDLCQIKTYFCDSCLHEREIKNFEKELEGKIDESEFFVIILLDICDYDKPWVAKERKCFLKTHPENDGIFILANKETIKKLSNKDIMKLKKGNPDIFDIEDVSSYQKFIRTINNMAFKNKPIVNDIKICTKCNKIFHDGNEANTMCSYHPGEQNYDSETKTIQFSCCNQKHKAEKNEIIPKSPGCCCEQHVFKE